MSQLPIKSTPRKFACNVCLKMFHSLYEFNTNDKCVGVNRMRVWTQQGWVYPDGTGTYGNQKWPV